MNKNIILLDSNVEILHIIPNMEIMQSYNNNIILVIFPIPLFDFDFIVDLNGYTTYTSYYL